MPERNYFPVAMLLASSLLVAAHQQRGFLLAESDNTVKSSVSNRSMRQSPQADSSSATQTSIPQLVVNDQFESGKLKFVDGRYRVGVEGLARSLHGSAHFKGERIVLTLPLSSPRSETMPPISPQTGTGRIKGTLTYYFDEHYGTQPDTESEVWLVEGHQWTTVDPNPLDGGSSVMYVPGKVMKAGGAWDDGVGTPSASTYVLDMTQDSPAWRQVGSMAFARVTLNLTLLPDGNVLVVGGSGNSDLSSSVYNAELWSPVAETWTTMDKMQTPRMYHSTALLLPDGRVLVAGGGRAALEADQLSAEIYLPPYLFKGVRPTITSAPTAVAHGSTFSVTTPDAARIAAVSLVRSGSVTHAFNTGQRFLSLAFQKVSGGLSVTAPLNANLAPPGYYMLFILDTNGIPSVAPFVQIH